MKRNQGAGFWVSAAVGWLVILWGLRGLLHHHIDTRPAQLVKYVVAGLVGHDAILAPAVLIGGVAVARLVRGPARAYVQSVIFIAGCILLYAFPDIRDYAKIQHMPTALPYNYTAQSLLAIAIVIAGVALLATVRRLLRGAGSAPRSQDRPRSTS